MIMPSLSPQLLLPRALPLFAASVAAFLVAAARAGLPVGYPSVPMRGVGGATRMPLVGLGTWQYNDSVAMGAVQTAFGLGASAPYHLWLRAMVPRLDEMPVMRRAAALRCDLQKKFTPVVVGDSIEPNRPPPRP
eukprot:COSAG01_NODE_4117_length_5335_cov_5.427617_2_plen_134_part_00